MKFLKQDICRFYKRDIWGLMLKRHDTKFHLNKYLFKRKKWVYKPKLEIIRLNNEIFKRRKWLKRKDIRLIDIQKLSHYFLNFKTFETFYFFNNKKIRRVLKNRVSNVKAHLYQFIAYKIDHIIFLANWAYTLEHARELLLRGVFLINNTYPNLYTTLVKKGDVITVAGNFKNYIINLMRFERLRRTQNVYILNFYRAHLYFSLLKKKQYRKLNNVRKYKKIKFSHSFNVRQKYDSYSKWRLLKQDGISLNMPHWKRNEIRFYLYEKYKGFIPGRKTSKIWYNYSFGEKTFKELKTISKFRKKKN